MAFMMNVSSSQVTSVSGDGGIGIKAAQYIANFSSNPELQDPSLKSVMPEGLSFASSPVQTVQAQAVGGVETSEIGRA